MADALHRLLQASRQTHATLAVAFQQMEGHALRAPGTDAWQAAQGFDQVGEEVGWRGLAQRL
jgi:hypothetical protein